MRHRVVLSKPGFMALCQGRIELLLSITLFLNLIDAVLTLALVDLGLAVEANPIMDYFLQVGPLAFMLAKLALVSLGVGTLWHFRRYPMALFGTLCVFGIYSMLLAYHTRSVFLLVQHSMLA